LDEESILSAIIPFALTSVKLGKHRNTNWFICKEEVQIQTDGWPVNLPFRAMLLE
jgi:hypothetical protein